MVHTWISLINEKLNKPCQNKKILSIFRHDGVYFYGDNTFDLYLATKHDYKSLESVVLKVIENNVAWAFYDELNKAKHSNKKHLADYISDCGNIPQSLFNKVFPHKEDYNVIKGLELRHDGNFIMYACETKRFYYVLCFATS